MDLSRQQNDGGGSFYVWLSHDEDGKPAAACWPIAGGMIVPLASTDEETARLMEPEARKVAEVRGVPVELVKYARAETLTTVGPIRSPSGSE